MQTCRDLLCWGFFSCGLRGCRVCAYFPVAFVLIFLWPCLVLQCSCVVVSLSWPCSGRPLSLPHSCTSRIKSTSRCCYSAWISRFFLSPPSTPCLVSCCLVLVSCFVVLCCVLSCVMLCWLGFSSFLQDGMHVLH